MLHIVSRNNAGIIADHKRHAQKYADNPQYDDAIFRVKHTLPIK